MLALSLLASFPYLHRGSSQPYVFAFTYRWDRHLDRLCSLIAWIAEGPAAGLLTERQDRVSELLSCAQATVAMPDGSQR